MMSIWGMHIGYVGGVVGWEVEGMAGGDGVELEDGWG